MFLSPFRIALAFENLTPVQVCQAFATALGRECTYVFDEHIDIKVPVPNGYRQQLAALEVLFGKYHAPYFPGPEFDYSNHAKSTRHDSNETLTGRKSEKRRDSMSGKPKKLTQEARTLWPAYRGIEEYAREVFPLEEEANGKTWMIDKALST